jgi:hypothetical protein
VLRAPGFLFQQFPGQLTQFDLRFREGSFAGRRRPIEAPHRTSDSAFGRAEIATLLQGVENWVERSGAETIPMSLQFMDDAEAENRFLRGVMQNMQTNETRVKNQALRTGSVRLVGSRLVR